MFCGLHVDNGRIGGNMKTTLREVIEKYNLTVRLTPNQNIILCDIRRSLRRPITASLAQAGLLVGVKQQSANSTFFSFGSVCQKKKKCNKNNYANVTCSQ